MKLMLAQPYAGTGESNNYSKCSWKIIQIFKLPQILSSQKRTMKKKTHNLDRNFRIVCKIFQHQQKTNRRVYCCLSRIQKFARAGKLFRLMAMAFATPINWKQIICVTKVRSGITCSMTCTHEENKTDNSLWFADTKQQDDFVKWNSKQKLTRQDFHRKSKTAQNYWPDMEICTHQKPVNSFKSLF